jgi:Na+-driven multidrug efflux pump
VNLPVAYLLAHATSLPLVSMYLVVQFVDALKTFVGVILVKKGIWMNNLAV